MKYMKESKITFSVNEKEMMEEYADYVFIFKKLSSSFSEEKDYGKLSAVLLQIFHIALRLKKKGIIQSEVCFTGKEIDLNWYDEKKENVYKMIGSPVEGYRWEVGNKLL